MHQQSKSEYSISVRGSPQPALVDEQYHSTMSMYQWQLDREGEVVNSRGSYLASEVLKLAGTQGQSDWILVPVISRVVSYRNGSMLNCRLNNLLQDNDYIIIEASVENGANNSPPTPDEEKLYVSAGDECDRFHYIGGLGKCQIITTVQDGKIVNIQRAMLGRSISDIRNEVIHRFRRLDISLHYINGNQNDLRRSNLMNLIGVHRTESQLLIDDHCSIDIQPRIQDHSIRGNHVCFSNLSDQQILLSNYFGCMVDRCEFEHIDGDDRNCRICNFRFLPQKEEIREKKINMTLSIITELQWMYRIRMGLDELYQYQGEVTRRINEMILQRDRCNQCNDDPDNEALISGIGKQIYCTIQRIEDVELIVSGFILQSIAHIIVGYETGEANENGGENTIEDKIKAGFRYTRAEYDELSVRERQYYDLILVVKNSQWYEERDYVEYENKYGKHDILDEQGRLILRNLDELDEGINIMTDENPGDDLKSLITQASLNGKIKSECERILYQLDDHIDPDGTSVMMYNILAMAEGSYRRGWGIGTVNR